MNSPIQNCNIVGTNVSIQRYKNFNSTRGDPGFVMSRGELIQFASCPSKWLHGIPRFRTNSMRWGTLMDIKATGELSKAVVQQPLSYINSKGKESEFTTKSPTCRAWIAEQEAKGLIVISESERAEIENAWDRIETDRDGIAELIRKCEKQVMLVGEYHDEETGLVIPVKALIDLVPPCDDDTYGKTLADFKTTKSAAPKSWRRDVWAHGYDVQAWEYMTMYCAATREERNSFFHIVQENTPPYEVAKRMLTEEFIERGRRVWLSAMRLYCQCLKLGEWPSYDDAERKWGPFAFVEPEPWMMDQSTPFSFSGGDDGSDAVEEEEGEVVP